MGARSVLAANDIGATDIPGVDNDDDGSEIGDAGAFELCFAAGTWIATPGGEALVEDLRIGDLVTTADGRAVPVKWIGRQTIEKRLAGQRAQLVRIAAGALGNHSDLHVTADHGMVLDGYVVNASALVNGHSIDWVPIGDTPAVQTVYHLETEAHNVILANGAQAETFVDAATRENFDNYSEYLAMFGAERLVPEMNAIRISCRRLLPDDIQYRLGLLEAPGSHSVAS